MMRFVFVLFAVLLVSAPVQAADFEAGQLAYQARDFETAYKELLPLAEEGNPDAQLFIGNMYSDGFHVEQNHETALLWYEKAAAQGNITAQIATGTSYLEGLGTEKNPEKAVGWFQRAADQNNDLAQVLLGLLYHEGKGVDKDVVEAYKWFLIASRHTSATEWTRLGDGLVQEIKKRLKPEEVLQAEARASQWKPTGQSVMPDETEKSAN